MSRENHPTYLDVLRAFSEAEVDCVVCGGVACVLQGGTRATQDIDLCVRLDSMNLARVISAARSLHMHPRIPEPFEALLDESKRALWVGDKRAMVYTLVPGGGGVQVDIFLHYPIPFDDLKSRADVMAIGGIRFRVSSKRDLIEAKRCVMPMRLQDRQDIETLEDLLHNEQQQSPS